LKQESVVTIKIIGTGFGRTGTSSLRVALEMLGFGPCYHMREIIPFRPLRAKAWYEASQGKVVDWQTLLQGYQATVDWPACYFYQELMVTYPKAKVILNKRDPERWYQSTLATIYPSAQNFARWQWSIPIARYVPLMLHSIVWNGTFHGRFEDKEYAIEIYKRHNAEVKRTVPPDRLLIYEVKEGWEPLCRFLNVPIPQGQPFPHLNDTAQFQRFIQKIDVMRRGTMLIGGGVLGFMLAQVLLKTTSSNIPDQKSSSLPFLDHK
jgi:hypothetical protein